MKFDRVCEECAEMALPSSPALAMRERIGMRLYGTMETAGCGVRRPYRAEWDDQGGHRMAEIKGAGVRSGLAWVAKQYGADAREQLISQLPVELQAHARAPLAASWYPIALVEHLYVAIPKLAGRSDRAGIESVLRQMSAWIAEDNLTTLYKLIMAFMTPERLLERMPMLWTTYYRGIEVVVRREAAKHGVCTVHGVGKYVPYLAPSSVGWLEMAYRKVGASARVREESWDRGLDRADPLVFHIEWS